MALSQQRKGQLFTVLLSLLIVLVLTMLIIGICILSYTISFVNGEIAIDLDAYKNSQDQTSIIYAYDAAGEPYEIARLHGEENRIWVDLQDIPEDVQNAFICLEDKRFYNHPGVDWLRTFKAVITLGRSGGGSTLTQQLIKNLTDEKQATVARKFNEILYALNMEKNFDKSEILEAYLNTIPLGSGCYGVQTAAQKYFGKDITEINASEAAVMAAITKAPTKYNPLLNPDNNKRRQLLCLDYMRDQKKLTKDEYNEAVNYKLVFTNDPNFVPSKEVSKTLKQDTKINSYYVDFVIDSVIKDLKSQYGYTQSEAYRMIYYGGLKIYCALDDKIQAAAEDIYVNRTGFPEEKERTEDGSNGTKKKVQSGITIMNYEGRVVAMVGGAGKKTINRGLNRATDAVRSPGSSIKPLSVYGPGIDKNVLNYSTRLLDYGIIVNGQRWPRNFSGSMGSEDSYCILQSAVAQSLNTTSAQALKRVGLDTSFDYVTNHFHLSTLIADGDNTDKNFSSLAVGGMSRGVTTLEMCAAYCTFGNGGKYYKPYCYYKVTDFSGKNVYLETAANPEQAIGEDTATIMNRILQTVTQGGGTGYGKGVSGFTTYMKTGTTSDTKDKWCCGGTPYYCAAVWFGYDKQEEMQTGGANPAANIWSAVMNKVHDGLPEKDFEYSGTVVSRSYCRESGLLAGAGCTQTGGGWYKANRLPGVCDGSEHADAKAAAEAEKQG
ncbi:MAG: transglycosylase domain-containing protein [Clostridia bacterium]|nr:transglycosylase domain-containing protein [Clostridia bacterium]